MRAVDPVSASARRNAVPASRTSSTAPAELIEPEASSTSTTSVPHESLISGLGVPVACAWATGD